MKTINYVITDPEGIHARPAGVLVKAATAFTSKILVSKGEKKGDLKKVFSVMALAAKKGDELIVTFDGDDEDKACAAISEMLAQNL